jgi:protein MPE1
MSVIFYKVIEYLIQFKSAKDFDTCTFDGTGISVFDIKRDIMINKKLGKGLEFDLSIFNAQTNEGFIIVLYRV